MLLLAVSARGQKAIGLILDAETREPLPGAALYLKVSRQGTVTDETGRYELEWSGRPDTLRVSYVGYQNILISIDEDFSGRDFRLVPVSLQEVIIENRRTPEAKVRSAQMGLEEVSAMDAKRLPALLGEVDFLKVLQLKPGVQNGGEGTSGLYVRGGGPDQNLFLVDDVPIYNPSHLFGFFSTFSAEAVQGIDLYKGTFPAQYGGRLSSVVDVKMRSGNKDSVVVQGGIGLISSRFTVEGPIKKGSSSFLISGRRTYFDIFTRQYNKIKLRQNDPEFNPIPNYFFQDLNGKLSFEVTPRDRLYLTGYLGKDQFHFARNRFGFNLGWGNKVAAATLVHKHSRLMFSEASIYYSEYNYKVHNAFANFSANLGSGISDVGARFSWSYVGIEGHSIKAGMVGTHHNFVIGRLQGGTADGTYSYSSGQYLQADEFGIYLNDEIKFSPRFQVNPGLRLSGFQNGSTVYYAFEPRLSSVYMLDELTSLKFSYNRAAQYLNLVSSSGVSLPNDLWYPSNSIVKPQIANQVAAGYSKAVFHKKYFFSLEGWYKRLDRQIDFKDGANLITNQNLDTTFVFGKGWSYGGEVYFEKKVGKTTGWIGYTLSWTQRKFAEINDGKPFYPRYDRRHDLNVVVMHQLSERISLSGTFVFGSGNAVTIPYGRIFVQDVPGTVENPPGVGVVPLYAGRNNYRMAPYHRADVSMLWKVGRRRRGEWSFSIYNLYARMNPYFIFVDTETENPDGSGRITGFKAKQVSLFPMVPSVSYNFRF